MKNLEFTLSSLNFIDYRIEFSLSMFIPLKCFRILNNPQAINKNR